VPGSIPRIFIRNIYYADFPNECPTENSGYGMVISKALPEAISQRKNCIAPIAMTRGTNFWHFEKEIIKLYTLYRYYELSIKIMSMNLQNSFVSMVGFL
jgi:hypothetical protein